MNKLPRLLGGIRKGLVLRLVANGFAQTIASVFFVLILHAMVDSATAQPPIALCTDPSLVDWPLDRAECTSPVYGGTHYLFQHVLDRFGVELPLLAFFETPTIRALAARLRALGPRETVRQGLEIKGNPGAVRAPRNP